MTKSFYSNGKLLITGEYAVLDGALSLAVPTKYGQSLSVKEIASKKLRWKSWDEQGRVWFEATFDQSPPEHNPKGQSSSFPYFDHISIGPNDQSQNGKDIVETLSRLLGEAQKLNPDFFSDGKGYEIETRLSFPRDWGLGSSSTLINNIAQWTKVDAFRLLQNAFSGSGYDIACAQNDHPILYSLKDLIPTVTKVDFNPPFRDNLYFVYLNKKQNSREGIAGYRKKDFDKAEFIEHVSEITKRTVCCQNLSEFESLMTEHETLLSGTLQMPTIKESLFPDFKGTIKSLGAWGGDFVLATGNESTPSYFEKLGYETMVPFAEMVLNPEN